LFRAQALLGIGVAKLELGNAAEAEDWIGRADAAARVTFVKLVPLRSDIALHLGRAQLAQKKFDAARDSFATADTYWQTHDPKHRCAGEAAYWVGRGYAAAGAAQQAREAFARAIALLKDSRLPGDARLVAGARQATAQLAR
jgi:tetratricopeptide (TPR) repeat protein